MNFFGSIDARYWWCCYAQDVAAGLGTGMTGALPGALIVRGSVGWRTEAHTVSE